RQAHVEDVRAAADLGAPDLRGALQLALADQLLELAAADDIGALADEERPLVLFEGLEIDARDAPEARRPRRARRPFAHRRRDGAGVLGRRSTAAAGQVEPALRSAAPGHLRALPRAFL